MTNTPTLKEPYIGLRPYREAERPLFFGREKDAERLRNKVFATPLTVLYAPSGVGKTSLLVTLVVPDLRTDEALVVYFDRWVEADPCAALAAAVRTECTGAGITVSGATLTDLAAAVAAAGRPLVLILDQFEVFLTRHAQRLDPLRHEIAALVRADSGAHVVLALRQEFLAALDVFRESILTLLRSTFHLQHLDREGATAALEEPAKLFGGEVERELLPVLVEDLRSDVPAADVPGAADDSRIELPFLQIVCQRLWREAGHEGWARRWSSGAMRRMSLGEPDDTPETGKRLTLASYRTLGGVAQIVREYLDTIVRPMSQRERADMARILDYLAPRSGIKMTYALDELSARVRLPRSRIEEIVKPLEENWILRERKAGSVQLYELHHDAFIRILRPWVDEELARARVRKLSVRAAAGALASIALVAVGLQGLNYIKERDHTIVPLERLEAQFGNPVAAAAEWQRNRVTVTRTYDGVAEYLVAREDDESLARLAELLESRDTAVTRHYGEAAFSASGRASVRARVRDADLVQSGDPRQTGRMSAGGDVIGGVARNRLADTLRASGIALTLFHRMPGDLGADSGRAFQEEWRRTARALSATVGIPVPESLHIRQDRTVPVHSVRLLTVGGKGTHQTLLELPPRDSMLVTTAGLRPHVRRFFLGDSVRDGWSTLDPRLPGSPYWQVPRWTAPIWNAADHRELSQARLLSITLAMRLLSEPEIVLNEDAVRMMLRRVAGSHPDIVAHAVAAPNGVSRVRDVLVETVRSGGSLVVPDRVLDIIAESPGVDAQTLGANAAKDPWEQRALSNALPAVKAPAFDARLLDTSRLARGYSAGARALPWKSSFRVLVSRDVWLALSDPATGVLKDAVHDSILSLRLQTYRDWGVTIPTPEFPIDSAMPSDMAHTLVFRIELYNQSRRNAGAGFVYAAMDSSVAQDSVVPAVIREVRRRALPARGRFLSMSEVDDLIEELPSGMEEWMRSEVGAVRLRALLRAVVDPGAAGSAAERDSGATIAHPHWLAGSLVFWRSAGIEDSLDAIVDALRRTQRARLGSAAAPDTVDASVSRGIASLTADQPRAAAALFRRAIRSDRERAIATFLTRYASRAREMQLERLRSVCTLPPVDSLRGGRTLLVATMAQLEDVVRDTATLRSAPERHRFASCLLAGYVNAARYHHAARLFDEVSADSARMSSDDAFRFAYLMLAVPEIEQQPERAAAATRMLLSASKDWEMPQAESAAKALSALCSRRNTMFCREVFDSLTSRYAETVYLPLNFALTLLDGDHEENARMARTLLRRARSRVDAGHIRPEYVSWIEFGLGTANVRLARFGEKSLIPEAIALLQGVIDRAQGRSTADNWPDQQFLHNTLVDAHTIAGNYDQVLRVIRSPVLGNPWGTRHFMLLAKDQAMDALSLADAVLKEEPHSPGPMFVAAFTRLVMGELDAIDVAERFLNTTEHEYRDYIQLLLYWRLAQRGSEAAARTALVERWAEIDSMTWQERLARGDRKVWREMLIGYAAGHVDRGRLFDPLETKATFKSSPLSQIDASWVAFRCEAYFYDAIVHWARGAAQDVVQDKLEAVRATEYLEYYEYHAARIIQRQLRAP